MAPRGESLGRAPEWPALGRPQTNRSRAGLEKNVRNLIPFGLALGPSPAPATGGVCAAATSAPPQWAHCAAGSLENWLGNFPHLPMCRRFLSAAFLAAWLARRAGGRLPEAPVVCVCAPQLGPSFSHLGAHQGPAR